MDFIEVLVTAIPEFFEWLYSEVQVLVTATPAGFAVAIPLIMVVTGTISIFVMDYMS